MADIAGMCEIHVSLITLVELSVYFLDVFVKGKFL